MDCARPGGRARYQPDARARVGRSGQSVRPGRIRARCATPDRRSRVGLVGGGGIGRADRPSLARRAGMRRADRPSLARPTGMARVPSNRYALYQAASSAESTKWRGASGAVPSRGRRRRRPGAEPGAAQVLPGDHDGGHRGQDQAQRSARGHPACSIGAGPPSRPPPPMARRTAPAVAGVADDPLFASGRCKSGGRSPTIKGARRSPSPPL